MKRNRKGKTMENPNLDTIETDEGKEDPEGNPTKPEKTPAEPVIDSEKEELKKKFAASSAEAIRLAKENKELKIELDESKDSSGEIPLNEKELSKKYPDWDVYDDSEKAKIRAIERTSIRQNRLEAELRKERQERLKKEEEDRFERGFAKVLASPAFSEDLKGREEEFRAFCYKDENLKNTNLEVLVKSFLFDVVRDKKKDEGLKGRDGLEKTSGGQKQVPPKEGMTYEEVDALRKSNPRKYNEMIRDGKLKMID